MATKKGSSKKGSSKKASKKASKKGAKKGAVRAGFPPPNLRCILTCVERYNRCIQKGVPRATCQKRLERCILSCMTTGAPSADEG
ncbi:MAG: hypothetical protein JOZ96_28310 [Acidobacteria bacterium]|nr:hypothetical protein [Acidobacteriota bacterium]